MGGVREVEVGAADAGRRLDAWLAEVMPELSRSRVQALIGTGAVTVGGSSARASARVKAGHRVGV